MQRIITASATPPKNPLDRPTTVPTTSAIPTEMIPTESETRAPKRRRLKISRPR
jgi:hypothetical protein